MKPKPLPAERRQNKSNWNHLADRVRVGVQEGPCEGRGVRCVLRHRSERGRAPRLQFSKQGPRATCERSLDRMPPHLWPYTWYSVPPGERIRCAELNDPGPARSVSFIIVVQARGRRALMPPGSATPEESSVVTCCHDSAEYDWLDYK